MFDAKTPRVVLGPYDLPTKPTEFFRCWADALRRKELPYVSVSHDCSTDDYIFVSSEQSSGIVRFFHQFLSTEELNPLRFFTLYSAQFQGGNAAMFGNEEEVTPFRCQTRNVGDRQWQAQSGVMRAPIHQTAGAVRCRVQRRDPRLAQRRLGVDLSLSGVSFENVQA